MSLFTNKTLLITGGTGSFGNAVLNRFLQTDIGDIRDIASVKNAMYGVDYSGIKTSAFVRIFPYRSSKDQCSRDGERLNGGN